MKEHRLSWFSLLGLLGLLTCTTIRSGGQITTAGQREIAFHTAVTDQLGNLYYAYNGNEIIKEDPAGKQVGYFSNNQLGNIGIIDATSPLKVLVFYPAFNTGIVLDRRLLETSRFNLIEPGFGEIDLVAFSRDGTIWIFDDHEQRLYRISQQGELIQKGEDLRLIFNERLQPVKMVEAGGFLYLGIPGRGLLVFDLFGQYKSQLLQPGILDFQIIEDQSVAFVEGKMLRVIRLQTFEEKQYPLPDFPGEGKILLTRHQWIRVTSSTIERRPLGDLIRE
jgi:hypothetical protein